MDLYAGTLEADYDQFFTRCQAFMHTWARPLLVGDPLNFEGLGFDMLHFVLDDAVYVALRHTGNFRVMHGGPHEVLVDKMGLLSCVTFSEHVPTRSELRQQAERGLNWFWFATFNSATSPRPFGRRREPASSSARGVCGFFALADAEKLNVDTAAMNARVAATLEAPDRRRERQLTPGADRVGSEKRTCRGAWEPW